MSIGTGHRVTAVISDQHVTVTIDGRRVADSQRPVLVSETGMPVRYYLPPQDVDLTLFEPTDTHTTCPFKGVADYWTYRGDGTPGNVALPDVVWSYPTPIAGMELIAGCLSFYDTIAEITVEGPAA